jgi:Na+-transporting methylmalonyl-CoA/oxaloacetate decarboxylase gamma subunit
MSEMNFGITLMVVGMGGTFLTLALLSLLMSVLKRVFPLSKEETGGAKGGGK